MGLLSVVACALSAAIGYLLGVSSGERRERRRAEGEWLDSIRKRADWDHRRDRRVMARRLADRARAE